MYAGYSHAGYLHAGYLHAGYSLITTLYVPCVGFSVAGLDHSKFGLYRFQTFLLIVVIVISIILETAF